MLLANPHELSLLKERNPPLADALLSGDLGKLIDVEDWQADLRGSGGVAANLEKLQQRGVQPARSRDLSSTPVALREVK